MMFHVVSYMIFYMEEKSDVREKEHRFARHPSY
jgi:hypothetical protein